MYELRFLPAAERYFRKIKEKPLKDLFITALHNISANPYCGKAKSGDLAGLYCYDVHYNKTEYRIAYKIYEDKGKLVVVILSGTRENFYKELRNYMK